MNANFFFKLCLIFTCVGVISGCGEKEPTAQAVIRAERAELLLNCIANEKPEEALEALKEIRKNDSNNEFLHEIELNIRDNAIIKQIQPLINAGAFEEAILLLQAQNSQGGLTDRMLKIESLLKQFSALNVLIMESKQLEDEMGFEQLERRAARIGKVAPMLKDYTDQFSLQCQQRIARLKRVKEVNMLCDQQMDLLYGSTEQLPFERLLWNQVKEKYNILSLECDKCP